MITKAEKAIKVSAPAHYALSKGVSVVVSAGNNSIDAALFSTASCRGIISVAAVNHLGDLATYSNYGDSLTVAAPGGQKLWNYFLLNPVTSKLEPVIDGASWPEWEVWSTVNTGKTSPEKDGMTYGPMAGTSMAAPVVSGVVSLMYAADRRHKLTPELVKRILQDTAAAFPRVIPILAVTGGQYSWQLLSRTNLCLQGRAGQCGAGIVDAEAAVRAVLDLK